VAIRGYCSFYEQKFARAAAETGREQPIERRGRVPCRAIEVAFEISEDPEDSVSGGFQAQSFVRAD
jgi:hypothetical protein